jgi:hypothetical protein
MSKEDEWCDVATALEGLTGKCDDWEMLGKNNGTPPPRKKGTDITPTVSLEDLAAAPGSKNPAGLDASTELTTDGEDNDDLMDHDSDKMMSSTHTAATATSSTAPGSSGGSTGGTSTATPDRLAGAAVRLASQASDVFIHNMDKIFDPDAAYPGGRAVNIPPPTPKEGQRQTGGNNILGSAQKIVGNVLNQFGQGNAVQQAACGKAPERSSEEEK